MTNKLKKYKLSNKVIAKYFGYKNANSFNGSTAKDDILNAVSRIVEHIEGK